MAMLSVVHRVAIPAPQTHVVQVETTIAGVTGELPAELVLFMPVWTPGSYLVREYARHVEGLHAEAPATGDEDPQERVARARRGGGGARRRALPRLRQRAHRAHQPRRRHARVPRRRGAVPGGRGPPERLGARVELDAPRGLARRDVPAALAERRLRGARLRRARRLAHRARHAPGGALRRRSACRTGTPSGPRTRVGDASASRPARHGHDAPSSSGRGGASSAARSPTTPTSCSSTCRPRARGGLEHRASAALIASPAAFAHARRLPRPALAGRARGLPRVEREAHPPRGARRRTATRKSATRACSGGSRVRPATTTGACSRSRGSARSRSTSTTSPARSRYLDADARPARAGAGGRRASTRGSSSIAPTRTPTNSTVSYYRKGEVVCALLDLEIRARTGGRSTLDRRARAPVAGVRRARAARARRTGCRPSSSGSRACPWGTSSTRGSAPPTELDLAPTLARVGLVVERIAARRWRRPCSLGVRVRTDAGPRRGRRR